MAGRVTMWGAGEILRTYFGKSTEPPPNFYLALVRTITPTPYIDGTELDEPEVEEYQRVLIPNDYLSWTNDGQIQIMTCEVEVSFVLTTEDWGPIRYWALCNAEVDGYVVFVGDFETPEVIQAGDTVVVEAGEISVSLGPFFLKED